MTFNTKDSQLSPLRSSTRRLRFKTQHNIPIPNISSMNQLRKVRINTVGNEEELLTRETSLPRLNSKLNLSPIKYYETRLELSAETWSVWNISESTYKRGWKPNKEAEFSGLIRLIIAKVYFDLAKNHPSIVDLRVRLNKYLLRGLLMQEKRSLKQLQKLKLDKKIDECQFAENTIILLRDLVKGMMITNSCEILYYSVFFVGFLVAKIEEDYSYFLEPRPQVILQSFAEGFSLINILIDYCNAQLKKSYSSTYVSNLMEFYSTPNELGQLFAEIIAKHLQFLPALQSKQVSTIIRFQVGFKFYEDRHKKITSDRSHPPNHVVISCRGLNNFGVISYNKLTTNVVVLNDCKFSMAQVDISRVEEWLKSVCKPLGEKNGKSKLLPLLRLLE